MDLKTEGRNIVDPKMHENFTADENSTIDDRRNAATRKLYENMETDGGPSVPMLWGERANAIPGPDPPSDTKTKRAAPAVLRESPFAASRHAQPQLQSQDSQSSLGNQTNHTNCTHDHTMSSSSS